MLKRLIVSVKYNSINLYNQSVEQAAKIDQNGWFCQLAELYNNDIVIVLNQSREQGSRPSVMFDSYQVLTKHGLGYIEHRAGHVDKFSLEEIV